MGQTLLTNTHDVTDIGIGKFQPDTLADGDVRVAIGPFALTANNLTYAVTGDRMGYWKYFDPAAYGFGAQGLGRMPVWGYGEIVESRGPLEIGTHIYGFFPVADQIDLKPVRMTGAQFMDGTAHRVDLHPIYNSYVLTEADPAFAAYPDLQPILRPLFATSFLIAEHLRDEDCFGAAQVLLTSASSKTSLGTAACLDGIDVIGLTSARNADFVRGTGYYTQVVTYDALDDLPTRPSVVVDMAGAGEVMAGVADRLGEHFIRNIMVGKSHWQGGPPPKSGPAPQLFFAPDHARARVKAQGPQGFAQALGAQFGPFCAAAADWMDIPRRNGMTEIVKTYNDLLQGRTDPAVCPLFTV